jgi:hypothetical protein
MSDVAARGRTPVFGGYDAAACGTWSMPDARRALQLALAALWLLDAILQYQSWMFTKAFGQMLADSAGGNPGVIARPITWSAGIIEHHPAPTNAAFATIQLLLALGIAWRPTLKAALAASVVWSVAVWWLGEGLGEVLNSAASPVTGAPGAVIIYALLAVLLWPADRGGKPAPFAAGRAVGARAARALWLVLWASLAYFSLMASNRAPQALHDMISGMADGEPGWLAGLDNGAAGLVAHQGLAASVVLAVVLAVIGVGVFLPRPWLRVTLVAAAVLAAMIWAFGEALGEIFTGTGTDPGSGPLLALLALAYWPARPAASAPARPAASAPARPAASAPARPAASASAQPALQEGR